MDSGAWMRMITKKDLNSAEMNILTKSCSPTIVITANGEVQTNEEGTGYVKELDLILDGELLDDTPTVLSPKKFCEKYAYSDEWTSGHKSHLINHGIRIQCDTENQVPIMVPGLSTSSSPSDSSTPTPPTSSTQDMENSIPDPASI